MMTQELRAGILQAPLAAIDRRALSQAWYSALGFARDAKPGVGSRPGKRNARVAGLGTAVRGSAAQAVTVAGADGVRRRHANAPSTGRSEPFPAERRAPHSTLARAIERALLREGKKRFARATFSAGDRARVHVVLYSRDADVRLIAFCSPEHRPMVARALAQARFALAARGIALRIEQRSPAECS